MLSLKMRFLSNKEKKELKQSLPRGYDFGKKDEMTRRDDVIFKNKEHFLIVVDKVFLPHLKSVGDEYKSVYVDKGAIPFIIKGADLMRPGIVRVDDGFDKDDIILVRDDEFEKVLAVGFSLFSSFDMKVQEKGKSVNVFHYVGDVFY